MALGSTQPLTEMSTRSISCVVVMKSGNLNFLEPSGSLLACNGTIYLLKCVPLATEPDISLIILLCRNN